VVFCRYHSATVQRLYQELVLLNCETLFPGLPIQNSIPVIVSVKSINNTKAPLIQKDRKQHGADWVGQLAVI
jgi:hypothetical protein